MLIDWLLLLLLWFPPDFASTESSANDDGVVRAMDDGTPQPPPNP